MLLEAHQTQHVYATVVSIAKMEIHVFYAKQGCSALEVFLKRNQNARLGRVPLQDPIAFQIAFVIANIMALMALTARFVKLDFSANKMAYARVVHRTQCL